MNKARRIRLRVIALALAAGALLVPVTVSTGSVEPNDACASRQCCFEPGSICDESDPPLYNYVPSSGECINVDR